MMEVNDMVTPENAIPGILEITSTPTRDRTITPVLPMPDARRTPVSPEPGKPEPLKKPWHERLDKVLKSRIFRLGLAMGIIGLGARADEAYRYDVIPIHQSVENSASAIFDNTKDKGVIGDQNIVRLTAPQIQKMFPEQAIGTNNTFTFLLPFDISATTQVTYEKNLSDRLIGDSDGSIKADAGKNGIKDNLIAILPKDKILFASFDAHVMLAKGREDRNENPNMAESVRVFYYDAKQDKTYVFLFFDETNPTAIGLFEPLFPMQENVPDSWRGTNWEKLPLAKQGESLVKTTVENQKVKFNIKAYKGKKVGPEAELVDKTFFLATPQLLTTPDINGNQKVVILEKN